MLIGLDFETYYDLDYTLRKMSTSAYVRDKRFEAMCVGIRMGKGKAKVYWGEDIARALHDIDWADAELLCHHTHFDGLILSHHYGIVPAKYRCTLSMARALHPKSERADLNSVAEHYKRGNKLPEILGNVRGKHAADLSKAEVADVGRYCANDVDIMWDVYTKDMLPEFPKRELELVHLTVKMFADPVLGVDVPRAKAELKREIAAKQAAITGAGVDQSVLMSNDKFAAALEDLGITPPQKVSKTTGKPTYAFAQTDSGLTDLQHHPDAKVRALVEARLAAKSTIGETRAARLLAHGTPPLALPIYLNYCKAHTTRWSGGDKLNPQNFERGGELRKSIKAPKDHVIVVVDSAQIEARVLPWLAGEEWLVEAFRQGRDVYSEFATDAYGRPIDRKRVEIGPDGKEFLPDALEGFVGKVCVLGLGFQMGPPRLQEALAQGVMGPPVYLELSVCQRLVNTFRTTRPRIKALWAKADEIIADMYLGREGSMGPISWGKDHILLPNGLRLNYPGVRCTISEPRTSAFFAARGDDPGKMIVGNGEYLTEKGYTKLYGGLLVENVVQALARIIVADQMLEISKRYRIVMMTHDETAYLAKTKDAKAALAYGIECFRVPPSWAPDIPLNAEGGYDICYSK